MRIIAWNIRAGGGKRVGEIADQLHQWQPALVMFSEFRGTPPSQQLAARLHKDGLIYQLSTVDFTRRATNALLIASQYPLHQLTHPEAPNEPCRWLLAQVEAPSPFIIGAMHIPNYVTGRKYPYHDAVLRVVNNWSRGPAFLIGDTNTGKRKLDEEVPCFNLREHEWMEALDANGWVDVFRHLHGDKRTYTWYSPNRGNGFRLDQAFVNKEMLPFVTQMRYEWGRSRMNPKRRDALSDHAAIVMDIG